MVVENNDDIVGGCNQLGRMNWDNYNVVVVVVDYHELDNIQSMMVEIVKGLQLQHYSDMLVHMQVR